LLTDKFITGSCTIQNGVVSKDGQTVFSGTQHPLAELLVSMYQGLNLGYPKFYKMDNLSKLGWLAAEILLKETLVKESYKAEEVGLVLANAHSSLDNDLKFQHSDVEVRSPSVFVYTLPNIVIGEICIRHTFKGEHSFFIQDKFDAAFIYRQVSYLLDQDILEVCICGWVDVLGKEYKAVLYLIEKKDNGKSIVFSPENLNNIFNS
jgi:hypothetical protein